MLGHSLVPNELIVDMFCFLTGENLVCNREVCGKWNSIVEQGTFYSLPRFVIEYKINICDRFGVSYEIVSPTINDEQTGEEILPGILKFDCPIEEINTAFRNCWIKELDICLGNTKMAQYVQKIADLNGGFVHAGHLGFRMQCQASQTYDLKLEELIKFDANIFQKFNLDSAQFSFYRKDAIFLTHHLSILNILSEKIKIVFIEGLDERMVPIEELIRLVFETTDLPAKKKLKISCEKVDLERILNVSYDSFLNEFCQKFRDTHHPETIFQSISITIIQPISLSWMPLLNRYGIYRFGSGVNRQEQTWNYYTKIRPDGWKLTIRVTKRIQTHVWKFKVIKPAMDEDEEMNDE